MVGGLMTKYPDQNTIQSMKKWLILPVLRAWALIASGQGKSLTDSLENVLLLPLPDSVRVATINKLAAQYMRTSPPQAEEKMKASMGLTETYKPDRWSDEVSFLRHRAHTQLTMAKALSIELLEEKLRRWAQS
jgi:hypothetical protein